jgi:hypothetical protein
VPYPEAGEAGRILIYDDHVLHAAARRARAERALDARHGLLITLDERFDAPVWQVRDPTRYAFTHRGILCEPAKADALHASADDETPCDAHLRE